MNNVSSLIREPFPGLYLLDLPQPMAGFERFISAWFFRDDSGRRVLVDPGPTSTIPLLVKQVKQITDGLDMILLTHIHLDHSGGLAHLLACYPLAKVMAHPNAHRHLINPDRLWEDSLDTLGQVALMYGEPLPVAPECLVDRDQKGLVEVFMTPGHASHHISFRASAGDRRLLFVGEAAGMSIPGHAGDFWCRPATPPIFDVQKALDSMALLKKKLAGDELLCYAHWGAAENPVERLKRAEQQLKFWLEVVSRHKDETPEKIVDHLLQSDQFLLQVSIPLDLQNRERKFMKNSVKGLLRWVSCVGSPDKR